MILVIGPRLECHSVIFLAIQTHFSRRFRNTEVTVMWNRCRSQLFSWHPNVIAFGRSGSWPLWSWRTLMFYGLSVILWVAYFYSFAWLRTRTNRT